MAERPIDFRPWEVQATIAGRKIQTRRVLKPQPEHLQVYDWKGNRLHDSEYRHWCWKGHVGVDNWDDITAQLRPALPYAVGDRLWVREAVRRAPDLWCYSADGAEVGWPGRRDLANRERNNLSPIHLPRSASRLTLTVTDVRVQRVQDISEADAIAEGLEWVSPTWGVAGIAASWSADPRHSYRAIWESLHGPGSWDANPWVAATTFTAERRNIDGGRA